MGDKRNAFLKHRALLGQPDCDELAPTTGQTASRNVGANRSKNSFIEVQENQPGRPAESSRWSKNPRIGGLGIGIAEGCKNLFLWENGAMTKIEDDVYS